jgi:LCP family protein required for cell wall assembly
VIVGDEEVDLPLAAMVDGHAAPSGRQLAPVLPDPVRDRTALRPVPDEPAAAPPATAAPPRPPRRQRRERRQPIVRTERRRVGWRVVRWVLALIVLGVLVVAGWGAFGYFTLRDGMREANGRLDPGVRAALAPSGSILSAPATTLVLGIDTGGDRTDSGRSDAIVLVRTDPKQHRVSLLSVPRDLRVEIPGHGLDKINAAYARGGTTLTIAAVERLLGDIGVNHVAIVDFDGFAALIDSLGGVTVDVPRLIVSNRFDCPYASTGQCDRWRGWRFEPGKHTLDGRRALIYSRIRENREAPDETDITRGGRQQQVLRAMVDDLVGVDTFVRLPFIAGELTAPLATDLSATDLLELAWVEFRSPQRSTVRCRLGGTPTEIDGVSYLVGAEDNSSVVNQFLGRSAPQAPRDGDGPFAPGCVAG